jgi:hypothetical protein
MKRNRFKFERRRSSWLKEEPSWRNVNGANKRENSQHYHTLLSKRSHSKKRNRWAKKKKRGPASKKHRLSSPATTWLDAIVLRIGSIHFASMEYACLGKQTGTLLPHGNNDIHPSRGKKTISL